MMYVNLKLPSNDARDYLISELNSYAYDANQHALVFLEQFFYDSKGNVNVKTQMYKIDDDSPLVKAFVIDNPTIPGLKFIKCARPENEKLMEDWFKINNNLLNKLVEFRETSSGATINLPVFEVKNETSQQSDTISEQLTAMDKLSPDDIPVDIPDKPINFGYSSETDQEVL